MRDRATANELCYKCDCHWSDFAMIDDMALLKQVMERMDAEDPAVAQAAKDRAAQTLSDAKLNFSKMAELIEQRRLLLQPRILANIKRMDQSGMLGDAAFRNAGSALRREGQSFRQIAEAIERTGRPAPGYEDPVQQREPLQQMASGSTGRRNTGVESLCWGFKLQGLACCRIMLKSKRRVSVPRHG